MVLVETIRIMFVGVDEGDNPYFNKYKGVQDAHVIGFIVISHKVQYIYIYSVCSRFGSCKDEK